MLLPHNKVSGGVQDSQIMIPSFFDRFYVMPPLTNGVHYKPKLPFLCDKPKDRNMGSQEHNMVVLGQIVKHIPKKLGSSGIFVGES